jgi:hypothetical protein
MVGRILGYTFGRQHIGWLGNEGAKMTNDSKNEADKTTLRNLKASVEVRELKDELSGDELNAVMGGWFNLGGSTTTTSGSGSGIRGESKDLGHPNWIEIY